MAITKEHIRLSIHFTFHLKKNIAEITKMICAAYGENAVSHATCKRWYQIFRQGDFCLEYEPHTGRDALKKLKLINYKHFAEQLGSTCISITLHATRKVQKESRWVLHELSKNNKNRFGDTALMLLSKFWKKDFLHKIITGANKKL